VHTTPENASKMAELAAKSHDGPITLPDVGTDPCQVISPSGPVGGMDGDDVSEKYNLHVGMLFDVHVMFVTTWYIPANLWPTMYPLDDAKGYAPEYDRFSVADVAGYVISVDDTENHPEHHRGCKHPYDVKPTDGTILASTELSPPELSTNTNPPLVPPVELHTMSISPTLSPFHAKYPPP
jgi:hypothetical protein